MAPFATGGVGGGGWCLVQVKLPGDTAMTIKMLSEPPDQAGELEGKQKSGKEKSISFLSFSPTFSRCTHIKKFKIRLPIVLWLKHLTEYGHCFRYLPFFASSFMTRTYT